MREAGKRQPLLRMATAPHRAVRAGTHRELRAEVPVGKDQERNTDAANRCGHSRALGLRRAMGLACLPRSPWAERQRMAGSYRGDFLWGRLPRKSIPRARAHSSNLVAASRAK